MLKLGMSRGGSSAQRRCFFCNTNIQTSRNSFTCDSCHQHNHYADDGSVMDTYAPVTDTSQLRYRGRSLALTNSTTNPFCSTCSTNQTLIHTLITNNQDEFAPDELERYRGSLELRYPPLCPSCKVVVDDTINGRNYRAKSRALGQWLAKSKGVTDDAPARMPQTGPVGQYSALVWYIRGVLWMANNGIYLSLHWYKYKYSSGKAFDVDARHCISIPLSILYAFWDPSWRRAQQQRRSGLVSVVRGRRVWIQAQMALWVERCVVLLALCLGVGWYNAHTALVLLCCEVGVQLLAYSRLDVMTMRQINLSVSKQPGVEGSDRAQMDTADMTDFTDGAADDLHHALSLDGRGNKLPIFGQASLQPSEIKRRQVNGGGSEKESDEMEWMPESAETPTNPPHYLQPQRFFAPQDKQRTGLEGPLSSVSLGSSSSHDIFKTHTKRDVTKLSVLVLGAPLVLLVGWCIVLYVYY